MTSPSRYLFRMLLCLFALTLVVGGLQKGLVPAFMANPYLNGLIVLVFLFGLSLNFRQVLQLKPEVRWLEDWRQGRPQLSGGRLRLLAPMVTMLGERRGDRFSLSAVAQRSLLDSIASRLDEGRDLARYFIGLMIFLGLLGTFWGLSRTVGSIGDVIQSLTISSKDPALAFEALKDGLEAPLGGMGTAFSTSLFGLAGSVVLGFMDLQAGQAQNAFYNELEEWLAGQTRIGAAGGLADGDQSVPAYIRALLEQTADSLDALQRTIARGEENRTTAQTAVHLLAEKVSALSDHMRTEQQLLLKLAESQVEMRPILARLADGAGGSGAMDETSRMHLRNMDVQIGRLIEIHSRGYETLSADLRQEFRLLARTIAAAAGELEA